MEEVRGRMCGRRSRYEALLAVVVGCGLSPERVSKRMIKHLKILLVDDDPSILELLTTFLKSKGFDITAWANGRDGLDGLLDREFDLVLSDIAMAGMNGFEFIKSVRQAHPHIGIVLMTTYDEQFSLSEALRAGADGYITKPFNLKKFSLIFEQAYWNALSRPDWWASHAESARHG